jgi:tetratricopeptide (TPR) repeat protein
VVAPSIPSGLTPEEVVAERYVVKRRLGSGGMGEAWLAEDQVLHRKLVLKRVKGATAETGTSASDDSARTGHLLTEAKRAAAISNPHIAQVYDVCRHRGEWLVAMEYVAGHSLRAELATPLPSEKYLSLAVQIAEAIEAAHASGILHCDIKPENILVTEQGFVKVLDFGLARMMSVPATSETVSLQGSGAAFAGTPGYMAPEILRESEPTEQSDIFALGVVLYEMAGGAAPFKGKTLADSVQLTLAAEPAELDLKSRGLPPDLRHVLQKALRKDPARRYATVRDLLVDLRALASGSAPANYASSGSPLRTRTAVAAGLGLTVVALTAVVWLVMVKWHHRAAPSQATAPAAVAKTRLLAVLPFHVLPDDPGTNAYSEGLREAITSSLAEAAPADQIDVLAASEVRAHGLKTPEQAHKELGADLTVEGSYQQFGKRVRISFSLIDAAGRVLRSNTVTSTLTDPFALEDSVVRGVVGLLEMPAQPRIPRQYGTTVAAAYGAYLGAVGYLRDFDLTDNLRKAEAGFRQAIHADPHFASAYAGLGEAQWAEYQASSDATQVARAQASCGKAMELNPQMAEVQICQGTVDDGTGRARAAQQEFEEALRLDPQSDTALNGLAHTYEELENPAEAQKVYQQAIQARPFYWANYYALSNFQVRRAEYAQAATVLEDAVRKFPANSFLARRLGVVYILEGQFGPAGAILQKALAESPHAEAWMDLGQVYLRQKQWSAAVTAMEKAEQMKPHDASVEADLADACAWSGSQSAKAAAHYREALELSQARLKVDPQDLNALMVAAYSAAALGDRTAALGYLQTALEHAPEDAEVNYYAARVYARLGDVGTAGQWLGKAILHGYSRADIESAPDLGPIAASMQGSAAAR